MEKFNEVIKDAERHLEYSERNANDLNRRIQEITRACSVAEKDAEESSAAIIASEKNLAILAAQQSDTRKKISALYRSLIAIPTAPTSVEDSVASSLISPEASQGTAYQLCMYNSLTCTGSVDCLMRHSYFVHSGLRHDINNTFALPEQDKNPKESEVVSRVLVDAIKPLCMYALTGTCTDKSCCFQHLDEAPPRHSRAKGMASGRSWRSLKLQKFLKNNMGRFNVRPPSECRVSSRIKFPSTECGETAENSKRKATGRYFHSSLDFDSSASPPVGNDAKTGTTNDNVAEKSNADLAACAPCSSPFLCDSTVESYGDGVSPTFTTSKNTPSSPPPFTLSFPPILSSTSPPASEDFCGRSDIELAMKLFRHWWASCQPQSAFRGMYECLQIHSSLLPFFSFRTNEKSDFSVFPLELRSFARREKQQWEVETLSASLIFLLITGDFIGCEILEVLSRGDNSVIPLLWPRTQAVKSKLKNMLLFFPSLFGRVVNVLQQCHDAMRTGCEVECTTDEHDISTKFVCSWDDFGDEPSRSIRRCDIAHEVVWLCTSLIAEVSLESSAADQLETHVLLARICDKAASSRGQTSAPEERFLPLVAPPLFSLNCLPKSSVKVLAGLSEESLGSHLHSESLSLAVLLEGYVQGELELEVFAAKFLKMSACASSRRGGSGLSFRHGENRWELCVSSVVTDKDGQTNCLSSTGQGVVCYIQLMSPLESCERDDIVSGDDDDDDDDDDDVDDNSESESEDDGEVPPCPVVSEADIKVMLREVFVDVFSARFPPAGLLGMDGEEDPTGRQCDCSAFVGLWLCIGSLCSFFDTPQLAARKNIIEGHYKIDNNELIKLFFSTSLISRSEWLSRNSLNFTDNQSGMDSVGALLLKMVHVYSLEQIKFISSLTSPVGLFSSVHVDERVCDLLGLVTAVLVTLQYSILVRQETIADPFVPLASAFQSMLYLILKEMCEQKALSVNSSVKLLSFLQSGYSDLTFDTEVILSKFFEAFPMQCPHLMHSCHLCLLTSDVLDLLLENIGDDSTRGVAASRRFYLRTDAPSIERICLKFSQLLRPLKMMPALRCLRPETLFQLAIVHFIAEDFDSLMMVLRVLLSVTHPLAMAHFSRVFAICFESDSLSYQVEVVTNLLNDVECLDRSLGSWKSGDGNSESYCRADKGVARCIKWSTYLPEDVSPLTQYAPEKIMHLTTILCPSLAPTAPHQAEETVRNNFTVDLTSFSMAGRLPAALAVLADESLCAVTQLTLRDNHFVSFPLVVLGLSSLVRLNISWNKISSMPSGIDQLLRLEVLDVSHNQFTYFPSSILKLKSSLVELYLQHNQIEEVRNDFLKLVHLQVLDVSNNRLKNVPSRLNSHIKLKFFRFSGNPIFDSFTAQEGRRGHLALPPGVLKFSTTNTANRLKEMKRRQAYKKIQQKNKRIKF